MTRKLIINAGIAFAMAFGIDGCDHIPGMGYAFKRNNTPIQSKQVKIAKSADKKDNDLKEIAKFLPPEAKSPAPVRLVKTFKASKEVTLVKTNKGTKNKTRGLLATTRDKAKAGNFGSVCQTGTVTAEALNKHFARYNGRLQGKGQVFLDMEKKYGISARFMAAIATQESSCGASKRARSNNDCFGMTGFGRGKKWASIDANIESAFSLIDRVYIKRGRTTVQSIGRVYCVGRGWAGKVAGHMKRI